VVENQLPKTVGICRWFISYECKCENDCRLPRD